VYADMKSIFSKILIFLVVLLIFIVLVFGYISFCVADNTVKNFFSELVLSFINGLVLALVVVITGILIEEKYRAEAQQERYQQRITTLKKILKNVFRRAKSRYNFKNHAPNFYFDNSWLNPTYELLINNNREWQTILLEYDRSSDVKFVNELVDFIELMDLALINTEKIDSKIESILNAGLAASMDSSYLGDRINAKESSIFAYWVYRASVAGADLTGIVFGMPTATNQQISIKKVKGLMNEAETLIQKKDLSVSIKQYKQDKKKLLALLKRVEKLIN